MRKVLFTSVLLLYTQLAYAQLNIPTNPIPVKAVQDAAMVIQEGVRQIEILSNVRALKNNNGTYQLLNSESIYSQDLFGVAYDHTQQAYVFLTGSISFKLLPGNNLSSIPSTISLRSKLIISPYNYVLNTSSPTELVNLFNLLKSNKAIEWVELHKIPGKVN
jgi:hypothetical protein